LPGTLLAEVAGLVVPLVLLAVFLR